MKCPNDQTEMKEGKIFVRNENLAWSSNAFQFPILLEGKVINKAYRCPKCGKIELYGT